MVWTFEDANPGKQPNPFELSSPIETTQYMEAFDVEKWYPLVSSATFRTQFCGVRFEEAVACVYHYQHYILCWRGEKDLWQVDKHAAIISELTDRIQRVMDDMDDCRAGYFVRMSCRSPKDVTLDVQNTKLLRCVLAELKGEDEDSTADMPRNQVVDRLSHLLDDETAPNMAIHALLRVSSKLLRATNAEEAISLLLASERVYSDFLHVIKLCEMNDDYEWKMKVVVREWDERVDLSNEFRCFVVGSDMTAISQYCESVYYEQWSRQEEQIKELLVTAWNQIKEPLTKHYKAVVLDFALFPENEEVRLIEVNPFGPMTGEACFDWNQDRNVLLGTSQTWEQIGSRAEGQTTVVVRLAPEATFSQARLPFPFLELIQDEATDIALSASIADEKSENKPQSLAHDWGCRIQ